MCVWLFSVLYQCNLKLFLSFLHRRKFFLKIKERKSYFQIYPVHATEVLLFLFIVSLVYLQTHQLTPPFLVSLVDVNLRVVTGRRASRPALYEQVVMLHSFLVHKNRRSYGAVTLGKGVPCLGLHPPRPTNGIILIRRTPSPVPLPFSFPI